MVAAACSSTCLAACSGTPFSAPAAHATASRVDSATIPDLGRVLVTPTGYVLYLYTPDRQGPSVCVTQCATVWPPFVLPRGAVAATAGPGVHRSLLGTVRRPGGALQVTYDRWPLYLYEKDTPGHDLGQDNEGLWYAISVDGAINRGPGPVVH